ncbi:MAG: hypothetical protein D4R65_11450 [Verrucomicrobiaceae bacterium]|nr:MAG: hypothetical protein D4R65_11450 [Verrucomicrobiaceae bacterium]
MVAEATDRPSIGHITTEIQKIELRRFGCLRNEVETLGFDLAALGAWHHLVEGYVECAALGALMVVMDMVTHGSWRRFLVLILLLNIPYGRA